MMPDQDSELETFLGLCAEVLGIPDPSPDDNFFELGGDSISAIELSSYATMKLGRQIEILSIFDAATLKDVVSRYAQPERHG